MTTQVWQERITQRMDNEDNDFQATEVNEHTYPHDFWFTAGDFGNGSDIIEETKDANGRLRSVTFEWFTTDFDRSAEVSYPVIITRQWTRIE
jgi:hypothetical protein